MLHETNTETMHDIGDGFLDGAEKRYENFLQVLAEVNQLPLDTSVDQCDLGVTQFVGP